MTKPILHFAEPNTMYIPQLNRRLRLRRFTNVAFKTDAPDPDDDDDDDDDDDEGTKEERMLLKKITKRMAREFQKRGITDKTSVAALVATQLNGLKVEELTKFDAPAITTAVANVAGELEKIKANMQLRGPGKSANLVMETLEKRMADIQKIHEAKGENREIVKLNIRAAAVMNVAGAVDETTNSVPAELIESFSIAEFVGKRYGRQYIYDIADRVVVAEIDEYKTWLEEGDEQGAFAIVEEGAIKPLVSTGLVRNFAKSKKVAGKYIITEEFAKFRKNAYNIIRNLIMDKLVRDYNALITADFQAEAAGYTGTALDGTIATPTDYDAVGAVAAQMESINFIPDTIVLNPQDKWRMRLSKDAEGRYMFPMVTENGQTIVLGLTLVTSTYQTVGSFTLAEKGLFKIEEEPITVRIGYGITVTGSAPVTSVVSDFDNNQMRVIVETFFRDWLATPNVGSIVTASFATVKTALTP
jgi:hypothetical protein